MSDRRRQLSLLAALVLLAVVVIWRSGGRDGGGGGFLGLGGEREAATAVATGQVVAIDLEALEQKPGEYRPGRDPFRFEAKKAPPVAKPAPAPAKPRPVRRRPPSRPTQAENRPAAAKPQPPPVDFVFLGSFGPDRKRLAVFSDAEEIFNVAEGGVLKEKFIVRGIGLESADIGFVGFPDAEPKRLPAGGKR